LITIVIIQREATFALYSQESARTIRIFDAITARGEQAMADTNPSKVYQIPDSLWAQIKPLLPPELPKPRGGRPQIDQRRAMAAILYIFRKGCKWTSLPRNMGSPKAVRRRFREWQEAGVFQRMWQAGLLTYDEMQEMVWHGKNWRMPRK